MKQERQHAVDPVATALGRLRVALDDTYLRVSRTLGLTSQQAELLCAAMTPTPIGVLAEALRCDRSNVSRLVDRASTRGWLQRAAGEEDGRLTVVELTAVGREIALQFLALLEAQTVQLRAEWSEDRKRFAADTLNEISDALEAKAPARQRARRPSTASLRRQRTPD